MRQPTPIFVPLLVWQWKTPWQPRQVNPLDALFLIVPDIWLRCFYRKLAVRKTTSIDGWALTKIRDRKSSNGYVIANTILYSSLTTLTDQPSYNLLRSPLILLEAPTLVQHIHPHRYVNQSTVFLTGRTRRNQRFIYFTGCCSYRRYWVTSQPMASVDSNIARQRYILW